MKKIGLYIFLIILVSCQANVKTKKSQGYFTGEPQIKFDSINVDFGQIAEGEQIIVPFTIKNTGDAPLVIYNVKTSCGCTVSDYPHEPIKPGEQAEIKLIFNSAGFKGFQIKSAKIYTNAKDSIITLTIHGIVQ